MTRKGRQRCRRTNLSRRYSWPRKICRLKTQWISRCMKRSNLFGTSWKSKTKSGLQTSNGSTRETQPGRTTKRSWTSWTTSTSTTNGTSSWKPSLSDRVKTMYLCLSRKRRRKGYKLTWLTIPASKRWKRKSSKSSPRIRSWMTKSRGLGTGSKITLAMTRWTRDCWRSCRSRRSKWARETTRWTSLSPTRSRSRARSGSYRIRLTKWNSNSSRIGRSFSWWTNRA